MSSIEEIRAQIALSCDYASEALGYLQAAYAKVESAVGTSMRAAEGSAMADWEQANASWQEGMSKLAEVQGLISNGVQLSEGLANRL